MSSIMQDILKLSVSERILMVEAIWNSIALNQEQVPLSSGTKQLLDNRLEAHQKNREEGSTWNDVKTKIKNQL